MHPSDPGAALAEGAAGETERRREVRSPVVLALACNEAYFPGLYCVVSSALARLASWRTVDLRVLDGGILPASKELLRKALDRFGEAVRLEFVPVDESVFLACPPGPGKSRMAYCRILLPELIEASRAIYLDCDVLVFRDLSELYDLVLPRGKVLAAALDSESLTLGDDSTALADDMNLPRSGAYFNSGVLLMDLDQLRKQRFAQEAVAFLKARAGQYRFWDQSAINFLLHGQMHGLAESWNRAAWQFDRQDDNALDCVLHYTGSAPWLGGTPGPAQALFEHFAREAGSPAGRRRSAFGRSRRNWFWRNALAPLRALAFPAASLAYKIAGDGGKSAAYGKAGRYWIDHIRHTPVRLRRHHRRIKEIQWMRLHPGPAASDT